MFVSLFVVFVCLMCFDSWCCFVCCFFGVKFLLLLCFYESVLASFYEFPLTILFTPK